MPMYTAKLVFIIASGSSMMPIPISTLLMTPSFLSSPIHAYTRSRNEVQNGRITSIRNTLR